jgi:hypothetical protein
MAWLGFDGLSPPKEPFDLKAVEKLPRITRPSLEVTREIKE